MSTDARAWRKFRKATGLQGVANLPRPIASQEVKTYLIIFYNHNARSQISQDMSQSQYHSRNLRPRRATATIPDSIKSTQHDVSIYSNEHISRLPPEILVKILINFDITSLIGFRRVSKQFEAAIEAIEASNETIKIGEKWLIMAGTKKLFKKSPAVVIRNVLTKTVDGQIVPRYPDARSRSTILATSIRVSTLVNSHVCDASTLVLKT